MPSIHKLEENIAGSGQFMPVNYGLVNCLMRTIMFRDLAERGLRHISVSANGDAVLDLLGGASETHHNPRPHLSISPYRS